MKASALKFTLTFPAKFSKQVSFRRMFAMMHVKSQGFKLKTEGFASPLLQGLRNIAYLI